MGTSNEGNGMQNPEKPHDEGGAAVWVLVSRRDNGEMEVEIFGSRPHTDNHPDNWPPQFQLFEGNINGGDSVLIEDRGGMH
jgi:hypothetical protein